MLPKSKMTWGRGEWFSYYCLSVHLSTYHLNIKNARPPLEGVAHIGSAIYANIY